MTETWRGIYPITSFVLEALGRKRDASSDGTLSPEEHTLLAAVEFWAAAAHGTLHEHLRPNVRENLTEARRAFAALGAEEAGIDALGDETADEQGQGDQGGARRPGRQQEAAAVQAARRAEQHRLQRVRPQVHAGSHSRG